MKRFLYAFAFSVGLLLSISSIGFSQCKCDCGAASAFYGGRNKAPIHHEIRTKTLANGQRSRLTVASGVLWQPGETVVVILKDHTHATPAIWKKVETYAQEWSKYANVELAFVPVMFGRDTKTIGFDHAQIVVSFKDSGYWSMLGTESRTPAKKGETTMSLTGLQFQSEKEFKRVVLHEFGHALGFGHEHQSPRGGIRWKQPAATNHFMTTTGWTAQQVNTQIFDKLRNANNLASEFDRSSIMLYSYPGHIVESGIGADVNYELSQKDKEWAKLVYPPTKIEKLGITVVAGPRMTCKVVSVAANSPARNMLSNKSSPRALTPGDRIVYPGLVEAQHVNSLREYEDLLRAYSKSSLKITVGSANNKPLEDYWVRLP